MMIFAGALEGGIVGGVIGGLVGLFVGLAKMALRKKAGDNRATTDSGVSDHA